MIDTPSGTVPVAEVVAEWTKDPEFREARKELEERHAIGDAMEAARSRAGMTQAEVAAKMGTTQSVVARLEGGGPSPSLRTLKRFAQATGQRLRIWFEDETPASPTASCRPEWTQNSKGDTEVGDAVDRIGEFKIGSTVKLGRKVLTIASFVTSRGMPCPVLSNGLTVLVDDLVLVGASTGAK